MAMFKKGDKCVGVSGRCHNYDEQQGDHIIATGLRTDGSVLSYDIYRDDKKVGDCMTCFKDEDLKLVEKHDMNNLQAGDILVKDGKTYNLEVQGVIGKAIITCRTTRDNGAYVDSAKELENDGWKLKDSDPEIIEFTLTEVSEKLNIPLEKLRIKE